MLRTHHSLVPTSLRHQRHTIRYLVTTAVSSRHPQHHLSRHPFYLHIRCLIPTTAVSFRHPPSRSDTRRLIPPSHFDTHRLIPTPADSFRHPPSHSDTRRFIPTPAGLIPTPADSFLHLHPDIFSVILTSTASSRQPPLTLPASSSDILGPFVNLATVL